MNELPAAIDEFILQWGDLGNQWGVNRSVAQIHAYLYISEKPLTAEDISEVLSMARSNVSNSLKELQAWNLISRVPVKGSRRDHFLAETDVWEIAALIAEGRKKRELDPAIETLRGCLENAKGDSSVTTVQQKRLKAMLEFTETADNFYRQMLSVSKSKRTMLLKMGSKIVNLLPGGKD